MAADMEKATTILRQQEVWACVEPYLTSTKEMPTSETLRATMHSPTTFVRVSP